MNILVACILIAFATWMYVEYDHPIALIPFLFGLCVLYLS